MARPRRRVIYSDREILVVHQPGASEHSLVTFSDLTYRPRRAAFWGDDAAAKLGLDAIGFVARRENWFPRASVDAAAAAVRAALKPRAVAYGYSMGGHGVLKHAGRLGIGSAIAVAPQIGIAPGDVPWDERFHRFHRLPRNCGMRIEAGDLAPFTAVIADPYDTTDWHHARLAAEAGPVHLLRAPLSGHAAIWLLAGTEVLEPILGAALAGDAAAMRHLLRERRARSTHWFRLMGRAAFGRGHARLADALWARATALGVPPGVLRHEQAEAFADRALRLMTLGRPNEAAQACRSLAALEPRSAQRLGRAAHLLLAAGAAAEAEATFHQALALRPETGDLHLGLSLALGAQGRAAEALAAAAAGHAAVPQDTDLGAHYGHLLNAAGPVRAAEAEAVFRAVLARDPRMGQALFGLASVLAVRGVHKSALFFATRAAQRMPARSDVRLLQARLCLATDDATRAERLFRRVLRDMPGSAEAQLGLADALVALDRRGEALALLRRAATERPEDGAVADALRRLTMPPRAPTGIVGRLRRLLARGRTLTAPRG
jgi:tetratricopeptide (TPR) repeat protein